MCHIRPQGHVNKVLTYAAANRDLTERLLTLPTLALMLLANAMQMSSSVPLRYEHVITHFGSVMIVIAPRVSYLRVCVAECVRYPPLRIAKVKSTARA